MSWIWSKSANHSKEENGDLLADSQNILNRWKNYFCQLLNVYGVNDVRQTEVYTAKPSVTEPSSLRMKLLLKSWKLINCQVFIKFQKKLSKQEAKHYFLRSTNLLILFVTRNNCHGSGMNLFIKRVIKLTVVITEGYHCCQLHTKFYPIFLSQC